MGVYIALAGLATGVAGGIAQSSAAKAAAAGQRDAALKAEELGLAFVNRQLGFLGGLEDSQRKALERFSGSFVRTPNATAFLDDAIGLSQAGFDFQTGLKRDNLEFVLGDSFENLRETQNELSALAAGDFSDFTAELNGSLARAGAEAFGSPVGTVFNIAARDRFNFRTSALNESLKIGDFFSREGTVDPPDPVPNAFALANFEQAENARKQRFDEFLFQADTSVSGGIFDRRLGLETTGLLAQTNSLQAIGSLAGANQAATATGLNAVSQGLTSASGILQNNAQNNQDQANFDRLVDSLGANRQANIIAA